MTALCSVEMCIIREKHSTLIFLPLAVAVASYLRIGLSFAETSDLLTKVDRSLIIAEQPKLIGVTANRGKYVRRAPVPHFTKRGKDRPLLLYIQ